MTLRSISSPISTRTRNGAPLNSSTPPVTLASHSSSYLDDEAPSAIGTWGALLVVVTYLVLALTLLFSA